VKREKEERKVERRRNMAVVRELLENTPSITIGTEWRKAVKILEPKEPFADIDKMDSLDAYQDYQRELDLREREDRDRDKEEQRRQDRKARDAFRALLSTHRSLGLINVKTRWSEYFEHCGGTEEYKGVEASRSGSRPKELFEYLIEDLEDEYDKAKVRASAFYLI
jgi:pre-mRNA-processing factor 40